MDILFNTFYYNKRNIQKPCNCIEYNVNNALLKWKINKNNFFHDEITEIFKLSLKNDPQYEFNNNLSENTLNEIRNILYVLNLQIENNIYIPCFLIKFYGIDSDQACVILNCLYLMDFCTHDLSLRYPKISNKGKLFIDHGNKNYDIINNWLNTNICTLIECNNITKVYNYDV
jgi:hypothetical protein